MRRRSGLPRFFVVLMVLAGLIFLGPPALAVLAGLLGLTLGLLAIAVKVGVIALGVYAAVLLLKALFGSDEPRRLAPPVRMPLADVAADPYSRSGVAADPYSRSGVAADPFDDLERRKDAEMAALDRELARTLAAQQVK